MRTSIRILLRRELTELRQRLTRKAVRDPFGTNRLERELHAFLAEAWNRQTYAALNELRTSPAGDPSEVVANVLSVFGSHLGLHAWQPKDNPFTGGIDTSPIRSIIRAAFNKGRARIDRSYHLQTGRAPIAKVELGFGALFGLTEEHALAALEEQVILSAGGIWDETLSDSLRAEFEKWFQTNAVDGTYSRDDLLKEIERITTSRLDAAAAESYPASYFEGLAEHVIVRTRNIGSLYRAKSLGATKYRIVNPNDKRTSPICKQLMESGEVFELTDAESVVEDILQATSLSDLKTKQPFWKSPSESKNRAPLPPLHWRCRSWQEFIFEGLND